jgi:hypothetical protein
MSAVATATQPRVVARLLPPRLDGTYRAHLERYGVLPRVGRRDRELLGEVEASGLTGRGGAAFPTATKLASVAAKWRTSVVANGTEGEPASAKDAVLLTRNPHLVLDGVNVAARLVGAREMTIAVGRGATTAADALERAIDERPAAERPRLQLVPDRFVAGEASALVNAVGGGQAKPTGRRPYEAGVLVQNVETLAHLALVARYGAAWFRTAGTETEPGTALATISGAVASPGVVEFELGTTLGRLLDQCGGLAEPVDAVLIGGYFGKWLPADPGLVLTHESLQGRGGSLGARVIVALPRSACGLVEVALVARYRPAKPPPSAGRASSGLRHSQTSSTQSSTAEVPTPASTASRGFRRRSCAEARARRRARAPPSRLVQRHQTRPRPPRTRRHGVEMTTVSEKTRADRELRVDPRRCDAYGAELLPEISRSTSGGIRSSRAT